MINIVTTNMNTDRIVFETKMVPELALIHMIEAELNFGGYPSYIDGEQISVVTTSFPSCTYETRYTGNNKEAFYPLVSLASIFLELVMGDSREFNTVLTLARKRERKRLVRLDGEGTIEFQSVIAGSAGCVLALTKLFDMSPEETKFAINYDSCDAIIAMDEAMKKAKTLLMC